jgi:hypothetical protein
LLHGQNVGEKFRAAKICEMESGLYNHLIFELRRVKSCCSIVNIIFVLGPCGVPMRLLACQVTADLFWGCSLMQCRTVTLGLRRHDAKIAQMDLGQVLKLGESSVDRFTTLRYVLRRFGYSFGGTFWDELSGKRPDADFPEGSSQLQKDENHGLDLMKMS